MRASSGPPARPEVWVNCAASVDGRIAFAEGARARLSSPEDLVRVQQLRSEVDGVVVGVGTVVKDDPSLRVHWELLGRAPGREPTRVIIDGSGRTPEGAKVLDGSAPTIVGVAEGCPRRFPAKVRTIVAGRGRVDLGRFFERLAEAGMHRLLVEGGSQILGAVLRARLYDRLTVYYAPWAIGDGSAPPLQAGPSAATFDDAVALELIGVERVGAGYVASYRPAARASRASEPQVDKPARPHPR